MAGSVYIYNMTNQDVSLILNNDLSNIKKITALAKNVTNDNFDFSSVKFQRDTDPSPHGKFGTNNTISFSVGSEASVVINGIKGNYDQSYDLILFVFYRSIVVRVEDQAYMYQPSVNTPEDI